MCKKFKFDSTNKWYMHIPASVLENDKHKLLWDLDIQTESPNHGQNSRPYNDQQKKRTCEIVEFAVSADHRIKLKEYEKKDKYLDLARELKKLWNMKVTIIPIVIGVIWHSHQRILKETRGLGGRRTSGEHPNCIIENGHNTASRRFEETCCYSNSSEKPSAKTHVKTLKE